ncbi:NADPH-dependent F420 reductase [Rhizobium ruizarguesonis]|uniref:NADPH-dependent F420 reductase n=1 Tax=Rhizobium ruizarguesonis TaxID=2081791 RepID=UPI0003A4681F
MGKLEGKVAVITGGSSGMALASARRFVEEGAYVFITGRRQEALDEAVKLIGRNVTGVRGDASNLDDLDRLFNIVKREKGKIDILYASAGTGEAVHREVANALPSWEGKTVIDATNAFPVPEELDGLPSSAFVAKAFTGAKLVKGFNHLIAATLAADPIVEGGHRVVFLSSDDEDAIAPVADLAKQLGFAPVKLGSLTRVAAGARTRPHLGPAHLPGFVQEGAVIDLRPM